MGLQVAVGILGLLLLAGTANSESLKSSSHTISCSIVFNEHNKSSHSLCLTISLYCVVIYRSAGYWLFGN